MQAVSFNGKYETRKQSQLPCDLLQQNAERTVWAKNIGCKRHRTMSSIPAISECDTQCHWLWSGSHNPVTVQPAEVQQVQNKAMRVIQGTTKDTPTEAMCYLLDLPPMDTRHKVEQVKAYLNVMQNPMNPLHNAVKKEKKCKLARG